MGSSVFTLTLIVLVALPIDFLVSAAPPRRGKWQVQQEDGDSNDSDSEEDFYVQRFPFKRRAQQIEDKLAEELLTYNSREDESRPFTVKRASKTDKRLTSKEVWEDDAKRANEKKQQTTKRKEQKVTVTKTENTHQAKEHNKTPKDSPKEERNFLSEIQSLFNQKEEPAEKRDLLQELGFTEFKSLVDDVSKKIQLDNIFKTITRKVAVSMTRFLVRHMTQVHDRVIGIPENDWNFRSLSNAVQDHAVTSVKDAHGQISNRWRSFTDDFAGQTRGLVEYGHDIKDPVSELFNDFLAEEAEHEVENEFERALDVSEEE